MGRPCQDRMQGGPRRCSCSIWQQRPGYDSAATHLLQQKRPIMTNWFFNLPVAWMALVIFLATFLIAGSISFVVARVAVNERAKGFKAVSPGILPPLGILFALLVGFIAVDVWGSFDKAKGAVTTEASALRAVVLLAGAFPDQNRMSIYALVNRHIDESVNKEWPEMAQQRMTLAALPTALIEALHHTLA